MMRERIAYKGKDGYWIHGWGVLSTDKKKRCINCDGRPGTQQEITGEDNE